MNLQNKTIAIIGLGYVGLPLPVEFRKHRITISFDVKHVGDVLSTDSHNNLVHATGRLFSLVKS